MIAEKAQKKPAGLTSLLKPYKKLIIGLVVLAVLSNGLNLVLPKIIAKSIDDFGRGVFDFKTVLIEFFVLTLAIFLFSYLQIILQTYTSERVAKDMRGQVIEKISGQSYAFVERMTAARLLTNLTADIDAIKNYISMAIVQIVSSVVLILGSSILLLSIDWKLGLVVLTVIPVIGVIFFLVFSRVRVLFKKGRKVLDSLNKVIGESILGASLIRVLDAQRIENGKFEIVNFKAKGIGMGILRLFSFLIPTITFVSNLGVLAIFSLGGYFVINGAMSLGNFAAFSSYLMILIFPIIILGFISNIIAEAQVSYQRIREVLDAPDPEPDGGTKADLTGKIEFKDVSVLYGEKAALKNVSFTISPGTKTAIIGPTAAGKSQLLYLLIGLINPTTGSILYDGRDIKEYDKENLASQVGLCFQDSIMFNLPLRDNIAFSTKVREEYLEKSIKSAELEDYVAALPEGLKTVVSERGGTLSGGQKQRIMLARALALNPKILLLDDFTARVDANTEKKILGNITKDYPGLTLVSVTQKIDAIKDYDQILLLMEGEILASGTHAELMKSSAEYVQIFNSQQSTNVYEELSD